MPCLQQGSGVEGLEVLSLERPLEHREGEETRGEPERRIG